MSTHPAQRINEGKAGPHVKKFVQVKWGAMSPDDLMISLMV